MNLICLIGFTFSYVTYVKTAIPTILVMYIKEEKLGWLAKDYDKEKITVGGIFWGALFSFGLLFPMSLPRSVNALRFSSLFGVLCSMYLSLAVTCVFWTDKTVVPDPSHNLSKIEPFVFSYQGSIATFPLIIFAYMYQVNIPMIYVELEKRNSKQMGTVISWGSAIAVLFYIMVGVFGYATFVDKPDTLSAKNILQADYGTNVPL